MEDFKRGLTDEQFKKALDLCVNKVEKITDDEWQDIVEEMDLGIHRDVLRKAFQAPLGGYAVHRYYQEILQNMLTETARRSMLSELAEEIGELDIKKHEIRSKTQKLNKLKKDFIKSIEIANDIKEFLQDEIENFPTFDYIPIQHSDNKLIVCVGDWHVGYVIKDYKGNSYNYEIAKERLSVLLSEIQKTCSMYDIADIVVVNLGDSIENLYMRQNQSYECEFDLSEQIVKAEMLLFSFITDVSKLANVEFYSVGGNHNRSNGSKDANVEGDNSNVVITENIKKFVELSGNLRIYVGETDYKDDSAEFEINKLKVKVIHGDNRPSDKKKLFDGEATMNDGRYDLILRGHDHNFNMHSQNGGYVITNGCLFGYNPYSVKRMSCTTKASQALIVVGDGKIETIKNVELN